MNIRYSRKQVQREMNKHGVSWFKFDESSGDVLDSKGGVVGTLHGGVFRVDGVDGEALSLNGSNGYVGFNQKVLPQGELSIRLRLRMETQPSSDNQEVLSNVYATANRGIRSWVDTNGDLVFRGTRASSGNWNFHVSVPLPFDNLWHDILFTWDGTTGEKGVKLYLDDMKIPVSTDNSHVGNTYNASNNLTLGRLSDRSGRFLNAEVDEIEIYNAIIDPLIYDKTLILSEDNTYSYDESSEIWIDNGALPLNEEDKVQFFRNFGMEDTGNVDWNQLKTVLPNGKGKIIGMRDD